MARLGDRTDGFAAGGNQAHHPRTPLEWHPALADD